jgi:uncharacterized protein involved in response to NO
MAFGFIPLFFSGFLFTAGPKWLGVEPRWRRSCARRCCCWRRVGCCGWPARMCTPGVAARAGLAVVGLVWMTCSSGAVIRRSQAEDQLHARVIGTACVVGCEPGRAVAQPGVAAHATGPGVVLHGLWGFVVVVYVTVAHRMIPFFTSSAMPMVEAWRPFWVLWLMLAAAALQVLAAWLELAECRPARLARHGCWCTARCN